MASPPRPSATDIARAGLCGACQFARPVVSARGSTFWLCGRSVTEPGKFPKYPPLPVRACGGFERLPAAPSGSKEGDP